MNKQKSEQRTGYARILDIILFWIIVGLIFWAMGYVPLRADGSLETYQILVYREHFPQNRYRISVSTENPTYRSFTATGRRTIADACGQPFRMTQYDIINSSYAVLSVSFRKDSERNLFRGMERRGFCLFLSSSNVVDTYDARRAGYISEYKQHIINPEPSDLHAYDIDTSTH